VFFGVLAGCGGSAGTPTTGSTSDAFANPQPVKILGYSGDAMEPFITRDGQFLFFNNLNTAPTTNLYWATLINPTTFQFQGEVGSVNTAQLDGVASMDLNHNFYYVPNGSYAQNLSTIYAGIFAAGNVTGIGVVPGISAPMAGVVDFDAEISADGNTLYFSEGQFNSSGPPQTAQIIVAQRGTGGFARSTQSATIMQQINTNTLNYAADTSASELELFFTRLDPGGPAIYMATRSDVTATFGAPAKIAAITGYAEAPSISPDDKSLYYHEQQNGQYVIYMVSRP